MLGNQLCARDNPIILNIFTLETRPCAQDYLKEESFSLVGLVFASACERALLRQTECPLRSRIKARVAGALAPLPSLL